MSSLALLILLVLPITLVAQSNPTALEHSRKGFALEQEGKLAEALYEYNEAIKADPKYPYPYARIGGMYQTLRNYNLAIQHYHQAIRLDSNFDVYNFYNLGLAYRVLAKHDSAAIAFKEFLARIHPINAFDSTQMKEADYWINFNLRSLAERAKPKLGNEPLSVTTVNSNYDDYGVSITADGEQMYFTSRRPSTNIAPYYETQDYGDDLFLSYRDTAGNWLKPLALDPPLNNIDEDGTAFISADAQTIYFALCRRPEGLGDCDIYMSELTPDGWTPPQNLGSNVNSKGWEGQPSITPDGSTMYYASRRPGTIEGSEDIYVLYRDQNGSWTRPINLGEPVNSRFNDRSPFISADGKTLYFSSNGHPGHGNYDLFMTRKLEDGSWSVPVNLGSPINAFGEDAFLSIPARGDTVYYSTQRDDARGDMDIYKAQLPTEFRPGPITVVAGRVIDKETKAPLAAAIQVTDLAEDQLVAVYRSNKVTGKFFIPLGTGKHYGITAEAPGYVFYSENYQVADTIPYKEIVHDLPLTPLKTIATRDIRKDTSKTRDTTKRDIAKRDTIKRDIAKRDTTKRADRAIVTLNNIFFDLNRATLRKESITELRNLTRMLKQNPDVRIEIAGHTDSTGTDAINDKLSHDRANAVRDYLVRQGIDEKRLTAKGYGSRVPVASNTTEEGRQQNRRTEFEILNPKR